MADGRLAARGPATTRLVRHAVTAPRSSAVGRPWAGTPGLVSSRSFWLHPTKSNWLQVASSNFSWPRPAGARTSCNLPGRSPLVAADGRCGWGRNIFANDLGGAGRTSNCGAGTTSQNHPGLLPASDGERGRRWLRAGPGGLVPPGMPALVFSDVPRALHVVGDGFADSGAGG
jgi:hypothetical protein